MITDYYMLRIQYTQIKDVDQLVSDFIKEYSDLTI